LSEYAISKVKKKKKKKKKKEKLEWAADRLKIVSLLSENFNIRNTNKSVLKASNTDRLEVKIERTKRMFMIHQNESRTE
jgi:hypothetical protein